MITFKQHISEAFVDSYQTTKTIDFTEVKQYSFRDSDDTLYDVSFVLYSGMAKAMSVAFTANGSAEKTGKSPNPLKVFSTIAKLLEMMHAGYPTYQIDFIGANTRVKLYDRLAQHILKKMPGGKLTTSITSSGSKIYSIRPANWSGDQ